MNKLFNVTTAKSRGKGGVGGEGGDLFLLTSSRAVRHTSLNKTDLRTHHLDYPSDFFQLLVNEMLYQKKSFGMQ